ncbi:MAG: hypothetical protein AAGI38_24290 [Bacteroidota bacterium]
MKSYIKADTLLHGLSQIIVKANRCFVPYKKDDSHTNLYYDCLGDRITGRWLNTSENRFLIALNLANFHIEIIDATQQLIASVSTVSYHISDIEKKIEAMITKLGFDASGYRGPLHYEIPAYDFLNKPIAPIDTNSLETWKTYRSMANEACSNLLGHAQLSAEIRIWPHHFDTGIYTEINNKLAIGFGLAMKDDMVGAPYFYMSGFALKGELHYENLPETPLLKWVLTEQYKGAVLPLDTLVEVPVPDQKAVLNRYIVTAFRWYLRQ